MWSNWMEMHIWSWGFFVGAGGEDPTQNIVVTLEDVEFSFDKLVKETPT